MAGTGSIQNKGNGNYLLTVSNGFDANGKRIRRTKTIHAKGIMEARKMLNAFANEVHQGEYVAPSHVKLKDYVPMWKKARKKKISLSTMEMYDYVLNGRILPNMGHMRLENIKPMHITNYLEELEGEGLSSSFIMKNFIVLNGIFKLAVTNDVLKKNPADKVDRPQVKYKPGNVYDSEELKTLYHLLNQEENKQMSLIIKLALKTGMRKGEILALQNDDVDVSTNTIHVNHTLTYTKGKGYFLKDPKTKGSVRKVAPPKKMMAELNKHIHKKRTERMEASELWEGGKYRFVFSTDMGKPFYPSVPNKWWNRFLNRVNKDGHVIKRIRLHDTRHTAATDLINKGVNPYSISKRLGHANISITHDIYGHYLEEADQKIADMLDEDYN